MSAMEIIIYSVWFISNAILAYQLAKYGILEIGIMNPPNSTAINAAILGIVNMLVAGYAQNRGFLELSLLRNNTTADTLFLGIGIPVFMYLFSRHALIPKGISEFNRARSRITYWTPRYYIPGRIQKEVGLKLRNFSHAQKTLALLDQSIDYQKQGSKSPITNKISIDDIDNDWGDNALVQCPNCQHSLNLPIGTTHGYNTCPLCGVKISFRINKRNLFIIAFGHRVRKVISPLQYQIIAIAHSEKGFLLRMMNELEKAEKEYELSLECINYILSADENNVSALEVMSLIQFRAGELAHIRGDHITAIKLYKNCLSIERMLGDNSNSESIEKLISEIY